MISPPAVEDRPANPSRWFLAFLLAILLPYLALDNWQAYQQTSLPDVAVRHWGNDFRFFFGAARSVLQGESPYSDWFFTSPPFAAFLSVPLAGLLYERAFPIFSLASILAVIGGLRWLCKRGVPQTGGWSFLILLSALLAGFPFQFLLSRGNIDGIVFFFTVAAICLVYRVPISAGIFLGLAASLKLYPLLLLLPLGVFRLKRASLAMIATCIFCGFLTLVHWSAFVQRLAARSQEFRLDENVSLAAAFYFPITLCRLQGTVSPTLIALFFFSAILGFQLWADWHTGQPKSADALTARLSLYFPLMVSIPNLVFNYEAIFIVAVIPAIAWLGAQSRKTSSHRLLGWMIFGAGLTQFHSVLAYNLTGLAIVHFIPAFGLLLVISTIAIFKMTEKVGRVF